MRRKWYGQPQINARIPRDQRAAIRVEARRQGKPDSYIIKSLVEEWYRTVIGGSVHTTPDTVGAPPQPGPALTLAELFDANRKDRHTRYSTTLFARDPKTVVSPMPMPVRVGKKVKTDRPPQRWCHD
jgi:hypothetical protein